jgi:uncharacterized protein
MPTVTKAIDVGWDLDGITMAGTLVRPDGTGPFPAVVLVAGSGPTDRDWCSPLLPGTNGSGRLLAEALADAGFASLRYDKRASGPNAAANVTQLIGHISMQSHLDELIAAVEVLAADPAVDPARIVGLGNSEGTLHVLHYLTTGQQIPLAAAVLAAPPGRPVGQLLLTQLAAQFAQVPGGDELLTLTQQAADRYGAGQPMDPDPRLPESIRLLLSSFEAPANLPLARELWNEDATVQLPRVTVPFLILIGGKDIQVDVHLDGDPLQAAASGMTTVTFAFPPNANHVLKEELRTPTEAAAAGGGYNDDGAQLDPEALDDILTWLRGRFSDDVRGRA